MTAHVVFCEPLGAMFRRFDPDCVLFTLDESAAALFPDRESAEAFIHEHNLSDCSVKVIQP